MKKDISIVFGIIFGFFTLWPGCFAMALAPASVPLQTEAEQRIRERRTPVMILHGIKTIEQAEGAVSSGKTFLEVDAQMTRDGRLVSVWGPVETASGKKRVSDLTKEEVDLALGYSVLDLEELFALVKGKGVALLLDTKDWDRDVPGYTEKYIETLRALIEKYQMQDLIVCSAFNDYPSRLKAVSPRIVSGTSIHEGEPVDEVLEKYLETLSVSQNVALGVPTKQLTPDVVKRIHSAGGLVMALWSSLDPSLISQTDFLLVEEEEWEAASGILTKEVSKPLMTPLMVLWLVAIRLIRRHFLKEA